MNQYPILRFVEKNGTALAIGVAVLPVLGGFYAAFGVGLPGMPVAVCAAVAMLLAFVLAKSYVELVSIIMDMLVPK
jgi:hypothetical protein